MTNYMTISTHNLKVAIFVIVVISIDMMNS